MMMVMILGDFKYDVSNVQENGNMYFGSWDIPGAYLMWEI
jgi:hypothetical protein